MNKLFRRIASGFIAAASAFTMVLPCGAVTVSDSREDLPFYFDSLTNQEQTIYLSLRQGIMSNSEKIYTIPFRSSDIYRRICELVMYNDELTFNLAGISASTRGSTSTFNVKYSIDNFTYQLMKDELDRKAEEISKQALKIKSEYERILFIHDYIAENTEYCADSEEEGFEHYAYGALIEGKAVCQGYSTAFTYLCRRAGIECINVYGESKGERHSWNKVRCDKKWYNVDVTWDDPISNFKENVNHDYFMLSDDEFAADHTADPITGTDIPANDSRSYCNEYGTILKDPREAYSLYTEMLTQAAKEGRNSAALYFTDDAAYDNMLRYLEYKNRSRMKTMLKKVKKSSGADISTSYTWYFTTPERRKITIVLVYDKAKLSDYFNSTEAVNDPEKYEKMGIEADIPEKEDKEDKNKK